MSISRNVLPIIFLFIDRSIKKIDLTPKTHWQWFLLKGAKSTHTFVTLSIMQMYFAPL